MNINPIHERVYDRAFPQREGLATWYNPNQSTYFVKWDDSTEVMWVNIDQLGAVKEYPPGVMKIE